VSHWAEVARVVNSRMAELGVSQTELAALSGVSPATLRKIQAGGEQKRTRSTLASLSRALGLNEDHLWRVSRGESPEVGTSAARQSELSALRTELADLARRVEALESHMAATADR
jgi:transcriptional regulator with XRE-family HTH domain